MSEAPHLEREYAERIPLDREVIKKVEFPKFWTYELMQQYAEGIPHYPQNDPNLPEWRQTPVIRLVPDRGGEVFIKNEADPASNPTKTIKDRPAWELATIYRDLARIYDGRMRRRHLSKSELETMVLPRFSLITSGNEGRAIAERFARHNLPPPKFILDKDTPESRIDKLKTLRADIYSVDLSIRALKHEDILRLTDNEGGVEITSEEIRKLIKNFEPRAIFYDWHWHEIFNEEPDEVYGSYGSGRWMENGLTWQTWTAMNYGGERDPRLKADPISVVEIDIFGAEPEERDSRADKLTAAFKPFLILTDEDIRETVKLGLTGRETGVYKVSEHYIQEAYSLLKNNGIECEPSGAAGLALYLWRYDRGLTREDRKRLIVNSGAGLYEYDEE